MKKKLKIKKDMSAIHHKHLMSGYLLLENKLFTCAQILT